MNPATELELGVVPQTDFTSQTWPIAAGMLQYSATAPDGCDMVDAGPAAWKQALAAIRHEGLTGVELSSQWLDLAGLGVAGRRALGEVLGQLGLDVMGYVVSGKPVTDPELGQENLAFTHRSIDAAHEMGIDIVCLGLHPFAPNRPGGPLWFWTDQDPSYHHDPDAWSRTVAAIRELGDHAGQLGVQLAVETYPGTPVGTAADTLRFLDAVGLANVGVNPDLGNLIRVQYPIEDWRYVAVELLPRANYWHVKNYSRAENPLTGFISTHPANLAEGIVNYRKALRYAVTHGFASPLIVEHYGGDGLAVSAANARYLRRVLAWILGEDI
jgi:sugar phosphate isomerase/epimerase